MVVVRLRPQPPQVLRLSFGNLSTPAMQVKLSGTFEDAVRLLEAGDPWVEIA